MNPDQPQELTVLYNNFTIYASSHEDEAPMLEHARPQDWGSPEYTYRYYYLEATIAGQRYGHHCHCWTDVQGLEEWEYPSFFSPAVVQFLMPGTGQALAGRRYLDEEDIWNEEWGPRPPYYGELSEN